MATVTRPLPGQVVQERRSAGLWSDAFGRLRKNRLAVVGLVMVILLLFLGVFGPFLAPWPYAYQDLEAVVAGGGGPLPPGSPGHPLGTDQLGRDLLSRLLDGARISVSVAIVVQLVILLIGVPIGAIAGWFSGRLDNLLMRFTDIIYAFPDLLFIILLSVVFRETAFGRALDGLLMIFVAIGLTSWVTVSRLVRGQLLSLKETEFVEAARAIGVKDRKIVTKHLLPNGVGPDHRRRHAGHPRRDPRRGDAVLHRHRHPAAARVMGQPDQRRLQVHPLRTAPRPVPGTLHRRCARQLHLPRGRPS